MSRLFKFKHTSLIGISLRPCQKPFYTPARPPLAAPAPAPRAGGHWHDSESAQRLGPGPHGSDRANMARIRPYYLNSPLGTHGSPSLRITCSLSLGRVSDGPVSPGGQSESLDIQVRKQFKFQPPPRLAVGPPTGGAAVQLQPLHRPLFRNHNQSSFFMITQSS